MVFEGMEINILTGRDLKKLYDDEAVNFYVDDGDVVSAETILDLWKDDGAGQRVSVSVTDEENLIEINFTAKFYEFEEDRDYDDTLAIDFKMLDGGRSTITISEREDHWAIEGGRGFTGKTLNGMTVTVVED